MASASGTATPTTSSSWSAFLKSIASFNGDLSSLTAPPFILSSTSLTEFSSYWCEHPAIFAAPAKEKDPQKRALLVLKWFLTTLKQQYASRSEQYGNEKKPLNPFLGELFLGQWEDEAGTTELISEQVNHHPPATAYCITNVPTGVRVQGYNAQKATFSTTINVKQIGHAILTVPDPADPSKKDTYLITLPSLHIEGLVYGSPYVELDGSSYITSSTGFTSRIDYAGKGWLSGKKNTVSAVLYRTEKEKEVLYSVKGQWNEVLEFHTGPAKKQSKSTLVESHDVHATPSSVLKVKPIEQQHPMESRKAWAGVAAGIAEGNMTTVGAEKSKIENAQRAARKKEKAEGRTWERKYFTDKLARHKINDDSSDSGQSSSDGEGKNDSKDTGDDSSSDDDFEDAKEEEEGAEDTVLVSLGPNVGLGIHGDAGKTGGLWRFDEGKHARVKTEKVGKEEVVKIMKELLGQE